MTFPTAMSLGSRRGENSSNRAFKGSVLKSLALSILPPRNHVTRLFVITLLSFNWKHSCDVFCRPIIAVLTVVNEPHDWRQLEPSAIAWPSLLASSGVCKGVKHCLTMLHFILQFFFIVSQYSWYKKTKLLLVVIIVWSDCGSPRVFASCEEMLVVVCTVFCSLIRSSNTMQTYSTWQSCLLLCGDSKWQLYRDLRF